MEVLCINAVKPNIKILKLFKHWVIKGKIYNVRKIQQNLNGTWGCLLEELINDVVPIYISNQLMGKAECGYNLNRFTLLSGLPLETTIEQEELIKNN